MMTASVNTTENPKKERETVRRQVLAMVDASKQRLTPGTLKKRMCENKMVDANTLKAVIRDLVLSRELKYTYQFGCSFIEKSYERPVRISKRVVLKPPDTVFEPASKDVVIEILKGASFGFGDHPTTRLAVLGVESALSMDHDILAAEDSKALDIGTGSGVLAIAAVLLGIRRAVGIDIDPCARTEAEKNVELNGLDHRIAILDAAIEDIEGPYTLITANLRYPSLKRLCSHIAGILQQKGAAVVSGITTDEVEDLLDAFRANGCRCTWRGDEKGWAGMVLIRV
jgi:ribosomal protein L11 methyltransferase